MSYVLNLGELDLLEDPYLVQDRTIRITTVQGKPTLQFVLEIMVPGLTNDGVYAAAARVQEQINLARRSRRHNPQVAGVYAEVALLTETVVRWRVVDGPDLMPTPQSLSEVWIRYGNRIMVPVSLQVEAQHGNADRDEIAIEGEFDNLDGTILVDGVQGEHAAPLRLRLQVAGGDTVHGFRVGLRPVPAGTEASDWSGLIDLTETGTATDEVDATAMGGEIAQVTAASMTAWTPLAKAEQPAGDLWKGRFITYGRFWDNPGTPSVTAVSGLAGTVVAPALTGTTTTDVTTYTVPTINNQGSESDSTGTGASVAHTFQSSQSVSVVTGERGGLVQVAATATAPQTVDSFSVPSGWQLVAAAGFGTQQAVGQFLREEFPSTSTYTAATTVTFSASTTYTVSSRRYIMDSPEPLDINTIDVSASGTTANTQGLQSFTSQLEAQYTSELAFLAIVNPTSETIASAFDGWTIDRNVSGRLAVLRKSVPAGTISARWRNSLLGTNTVAALVTLLGEPTTTPVSSGGTYRDTGVTRAGTYTATVQRADSHGNVSAAATPVAKVVTSDGSRIDWTWTLGGGGPFLFSWQTPDGRFRQVQTREASYSLTDDDVGSIIYALPTTGTATERASQFRVRTGTPDAVTLGTGLGAGVVVSLADDDTWLSTVVGAWDWSQTPPDDDGNRPDGAVLIDAVSGSTASATVKADMLRFFDADGVVFTVLTSVPCSLVHAELLPDGTVTAWGEVVDGETTETYPATVIGEPRIPPGTVLMSVEALGTVVEIGRSYVSDLSLAFSVEELSYLPEYTFQAGSE